MSKKLIKSRGYTLIELLLYVGIVALLSIGIYKIYDKRTIDVNVYVMSQNLENIDKGLSSAYITSTNFGSLDNTFAIKSNIIPNNLVINPTTIGNMFGGTLILGSTTLAGTPAFTIELANVPAYACSKLGTSNYARKVQELEINGTIVKPNLTPFSSTIVATITSQCNQPNNIIIYKNTILLPLLNPTGSTAFVRPKEDPSYIATVGSVSTSSATTCSGGSSWNGSFCSCPTGREWSGTSCIAFGTTTTPGWCPRGQGWLPGTKVCAALPNGSSSNAYNGGRNLPGIIATPPTQSVVGGQILPAATPVGIPEVIAGRSITWQAGQADNYTVQVCVNGSWDATKRRCVTPVLP